MLESPLVADLTALAPREPHGTPKKLVLLNTVETQLAACPEGSVSSQGAVRTVTSKMTSAAPAWATRVAQKGSDGWNEGTYRKKHDSGDAYSPCRRS